MKFTGNILPTGGYKRVHWSQAPAEGLSTSTAAGEPVREWKLFYVDWLGWRLGVCFATKA